MPVLALLLAALLVVTANAAASPDSQNIVRVPLKRLPIPGSRVFSFANRPWAAHLPTAPGSVVPDGRPSTSHLSFPLTLKTETSNSIRLPKHAIYGNIVTLGEYYVTLSFGGQPINVQVDTGSSTIAVPLKDCLNCRPHDHRLDLATASGTAGFIGCDSPACRPNTCSNVGLCSVCSVKTKACCSVAAPDACGFFLKYADDSGVSGALVQTDVSIAGLTVPLVFGAILRETEDFENTNVDGILGMAYRSLACNPTCVEPLFDTLVQAGKVKHDVFSLCTQNNGGTLILGGSSDDFYEGELQYVPMIHGSGKHFYDVTIEEVHIGGEKVKVPSFADAIVDSGTTVLVMTPKAYNAIKKYFQDNYCDVPGLCVNESGKQVTSAHVIKKPGEVQKEEVADLSLSERASSDDRSWFSPGYCVLLDDKHLKMLPNITIGLQNGVKLILDPETYMLKYEVISTFPWEKVVYRCLGMSFLEGLEKMENNAILGNTVLQKYFVEYDRKKDRLGFAIAKNCIDSSTRMLDAESALSDSVRTLPRWVLILFTAATIGAWVLLIAMCVRESRKYSEYRPIPSSRYR